MIGNNCKVFLQNLYLRTLIFQTGDWIVFVTFYGLFFRPIEHIIFVNCIGCFNIFIILLVFLITKGFKKIKYSKIMVNQWKYGNYLVTLRVMRKSLIVAYILENSLFENHTIIASRYYLSLISFHPMLTLQIWWILSTPNLNNDIQIWTIGKKIHWFLYICCMIYIPSLKWVLVLWSIEILG